MKFKKIQNKMLATILPVVLVAFATLNIVAGTFIRSVASEEIEENMIAQRNQVTTSVENSLESVAIMAQVLASDVGVSYHSSLMSDFERIFSEAIQTNDVVLGSGIWFEPYTFGSDKKYMGPYMYKDGDEVLVTYDYSNADYDYFNQEYYLNAKNSTGPVFTDPYWDETSQTVMTSCSTPIYQSTGQFLGCVTVDIQLDTLREMIDSVQIGEAGTAFLLTSDGTYIAGVDDEKIMAAAKMTEEGGDVANVANQILENESGSATYRDNGQKYNLYFSTIEGTNWKVGVKVPTSQINAPVVRALIWLSVIAIIALAFAFFVINLQVRSIAKGIDRVKQFAGHLAEGNFTVDTLDVKTRDELGAMSSSLNEMFGSNREVITNISNRSTEISDSSKKLNDASENLLHEFTEIQDGMQRINSAMLNTSAATEEVNASAEEVGASVTSLAAETERSLELAEEIQDRAKNVERMAAESSASAKKLAKQFEGELAASVENAKVVSNINELANVIAEIAEQINLLSLNASIEAARAGEHGKGFAVVASEIGKLANDTSQAVGDIQATIGKVQGAFEQLNGSAQSMLDFVSDTVTPDYDRFVETANQYGQDAEFFAEISNKVADMSNNIQIIMTEVTDAIQSIAESSVDTTKTSGDVVETVNEAAERVEEVSGMSKMQNDIAVDLDDMVHRFQL